MSVAHSCPECGKTEYSDKPHKECRKPKEQIHIKSVAELEGKSPDLESQASAATSDEILEERIMSASIAKTEAEWWARRRIHKQHEVLEKIAGGNADIGHLTGEDCIRIANQALEGKFVRKSPDAEMTAGLEVQAIQTTFTPESIVLCLRELADVWKTNVQDGIVCMVAAGIIDKQAEQIEAKDDEIDFLNTSASGMSDLIEKQAEQIEAKDEAITFATKTTRLLSYMAEGRCECDAATGMAPCMPCDARRIITKLEQALKGDPCKKEG